MSDPLPRPTSDQASRVAPGVAVIKRATPTLLTLGSLLVIGLLLIFALGLAQRMGWIQANSGTAAATGSESAAIHTCPMHPQIRQPGPGRCPICGMALVAAAQVGASVDDLAVRIEPAQRRLANIETAPAILEPVTTKLRTIGSIQIDESRMATIAAYVDGRVERLFADYTGIDVQRGDHLAVIYSPELYSAQVEYLNAGQSLDGLTANVIDSVRKITENLVTNSRQRLAELGMTSEQIQTLNQTGQAQSRLTIYAPTGGTVIEKLTEEGKYVKAGEPIYRIANLSTIWLMLQLYPEDASRIRFGQEVVGQLSSFPDTPLTGRVAFIDPTVDPKTRTVGVRVEFDNADKALRPGDYAHATISIPIGPQGTIYDDSLAGKWISPMHPQVIRSEPGDCPICGMKLVPTSDYGFSNTPVAQPLSLVVPRSAVLLAGEHSVVYVETEPGRFEIRQVTLGPILGDRAIILDGLQAGDEVAVSGNFLIDSQMQLAGKPSLIDPMRLKVKQPRNTPLEFDTMTIQPVDGQAGQFLESLYAAYFEVQRALASDNLPSADSAQRLFDLATSLKDELADEEIKALLVTIAEQAEHLAHQSLAEARAAFKPLSHAVVTLSTKRRGAAEATAFHQFFCPMVKGGEGDWLQADDKLLNPYFGSEMLRCGELVRTISPSSR